MTAWRYPVQSMADASQVMFRSLPHTWGRTHDPASPEPEVSLLPRPLRPQMRVAGTRQYRTIPCNYARSITVEEPRRALCAAFDGWGSQSRESKFRRGYNELDTISGSGWGIRPGAPRPSPTRVERLSYAAPTRLLDSMAVNLSSHLPDTAPSAARRIAMRRSRCSMREETESRSKDTWADPRTPP